MTANEIIKRLFIAFSKQDSEDFYRIADEFINLEKRKKHNIAAKELKEALYSSKPSRSNNDSNRYRANIPIPRDNDSGFPLLEIKEYEHDWDELIVSEEIKYVLYHICNEFRSIDILSTYNLTPIKKVLFSGQPGTGKTFTAQVLSSVLQIPLIYIRFDAIISSYLGETATNLRKVFDFIANGVWIVLFDEVDIIGKNRDDHYENGEIKRVVNNFLQMLDTFEGESLLICATNHPHILDPAIWRRFDEIINFDLPSELERLRLLKLYLKPMKKAGLINLEELSQETSGFTPSDLKLMCKEAMKHAIVSEKDQLSTPDIEFALNRMHKRFSIRDEK